MDSTRSYPSRFNFHGAAVLFPGSTIPLTKARTYLRIPGVQGGKLGKRIIPLYTQDSDDLRGFCCTTLI